jgi:hypothetical protein
MVVFFFARWISNQWLLSIPNSDSSALSDSRLPEFVANQGESGGTGVEGHPLDEVIRLAEESMERHKVEHFDYRAMVRKRERIGKELGPETRMELKLRYREMDSGTHLRRIDVYLRFLEPKAQSGREVIWREGINEDLMVVHESGFLNLTRLELLPTSRLAMLGNRYPVSDIGFERLLTKLLSKGHRDRSLGACLVRIDESVQTAGRECRRIEVCHPERQVVIGERNIEHEFFKAIIDIDSEYGIPIRYASYMWPETPDGEAILDEEFVYEQLQLNVKLEDQDFDPDNPAYNYP